MSEWRELAEWDWVVLGDGLALHAVSGLSNSDTVDADWIGYGSTACGRDGELTIPGLFSRMDGPRCTRCCVKTGMPAGLGSPKNDEACRPRVERRLAALGQDGRS